MEFLMGLAVLVTFFTIMLLLEKYEEEKQRKRELRKLTRMWRHNWLAIGGRRY